VRRAYMVGLEDAGEATMQGLVEIGLPNANVRGLDTPRTPRSEAPIRATARPTQPAVPTSRTRAATS
jgi:hypothetical protein